MSHDDESRIGKLTRQILRDREQRAAANTNAIECHACGRKFSGRDDGHCSDRCLAWTERGEAPYSEHSRFDPFDVTRWRVIAGGDPGYLPKTPMRKTATGFMVACRGCGRSFDSKGLAHCAECREIPADERRQIHPTASGRLCQAPGCENFVPRRARADIRYCSRACRERAYRNRKKGMDNPDQVLDSPHQLTVTPVGPVATPVGPAALAGHDRTLGPTGPAG